MNTPPLRPSWLEIDTRAIENNARVLTRILGTGCELMAMVKANGYGHGAVETARAALRGGATWLGVYSVGEGLELRTSGISAKILVLGPTPPEWVESALANNLTLTIGGEEYFAPLARAARSLGLRARAHVKIDTGMTRLGLPAATAVSVIRRWAGEGLEIEGVLTHFAVADDPDARGIPGWGKEFTRRQLETFNSILDELAAAGTSPRYRHAANSPALVSYPDARLNLARSGILLYGLNPSATAGRPDGFAPALTFKTRLALVRDAPRGSTVSYGATFETQRDSRIGVLMVGYADGFRRGPSNYGDVLVRSRRAPIVGRVCMDQAMIDITDIPEAVSGDEVVLIGRQGSEEITAEEVGLKTGTINYEVVTSLSARLPRIYKS